MEKIIDYLFMTKALWVSEGDPFWYTSGDFGPFYVNTHYLYGNKEDAENLLAFIDSNILKDDFEDSLTKMVKEQYRTNEIYRTLINEFVDDIKKNVSVDKYRFVSGGERRDWFFSIMTAELLDKEHVFLYKDNSSNLKTLSNQYVLHVSDLINTASSYEKNWKPAVLSHNGILEETYTVVDRLQGGAEALKEIEIKLHSLIRFDCKIFESAYKNGKLNERQFDMIKDYLRDPVDFMSGYLKNHPAFLEDSIKKGGKEKQRALLYKEKHNESR